MVFRYRLQKVLELREGELEKAKTGFQSANSQLKEAELELKESFLREREQQVAVSQAREPRIIPLILNRINFLREERKELESKREQAAENLEKAREELIKAQQNLEILYKHRKKLKEQSDKDEQRKEQAELNEIALMLRRYKNQED